MTRSIRAIALAFFLFAFQSNLQAQDNSSITLEQAEKELKDAFSEYTRLVTVGGAGDPQAALERYRKSHALVEELKARVKEDIAPSVAPAVAEPLLQTSEPKATKPTNETVEIGVEAPIGEVDWSKVDIMDPGAAKIAHEWLGWLAANGGVDVIIQPRNHFEFFGELGKVARSNLRDRKKVSRIVISAHGSPTEPGFNLEKAVLPAHVDIPQLNRQVVEKRDEIFKLKERLYAADAGLGELAPEERKQLLDGMALAARTYDTNLQFLNDMEHISLVMDEDAAILLAVCYQSRTPAHEEFIKSFGESILSYSGGAVATARTAVALSRGNLIVNYWMDFFGIEEEKGAVGISTERWWTDYYKNGVSPTSSQMSWFTVNWALTRIEKLTRTISPLKISFNPDLREVEPGGSLEIKPVVDSFPDSGLLNYRWTSAGKESTAEVFSLEVPPEAVGLQKVDLVVRDARGREGTGRMFVKINKPSGRTSVESSYRFTVGDISGGAPSQGLVSFKHLWSEPPQELVPGQPFSIDLEMHQLERSLPSDAIIIGDIRFSVGVMVTAGREWIDNFVKNDRPSRKQGQVYEIPSPSSQLFLGEYLVAGYLSDFDPTQANVPKWLENANKRFTALVPGLIPNKDTYEVPKANIDGEQLLVIIYAIGSGGAVYVDSNYLYQAAAGSGGSSVWRLVRQWQTEDKEWKAPDDSSSASMR